MGSSLWKNCPQRALAALVCIPSGSPNVVELRRRIQECMFGPGLSRDFGFCVFYFPFIVHRIAESVPFADHVPVWGGDSAATLSPWTCWLASDDFDAAHAEQEIRCRADLVEWLAPLSKKVLQCSCNFPQENCWAHVLQKVSRSVFAEYCSVVEYVPVAVSDEAELSASIAADVNIAGGVQPRGRKLPQLIRDGLTPAEHIARSVAIEHPVAVQAAPSKSVEYAVKHSAWSAEEVVARRIGMCDLIKGLALAVAEESEFVLERCHVEVARVARAYGTKNVCLTRELQFIVGTSDSIVCLGLVLGLPQIGWAPAAQGLTLRRRLPEQSRKIGTLTAFSVARKSCGAPNTRETKN